MGVRRHQWLKHSQNGSHEKLQREHAENTMCGSSKRGSDKTGDNRMEKAKRTDENG